MKRRKARIKARLKRRFIERQLGKLLPEHRAAIKDPDTEVLLVAIPMPKKLLTREQTRSERADVCELAGTMARISATQTVRNRVGSSAVPHHVTSFMREWRPT